MVLAVATHGGDDVQIMRYRQPSTLILLAMGNHRQVAMSSTAFPLHLWL